MTIKIYQIDAFTDTLFGGNPAAVCPLEAWLPDTILQAIAAENNVSETAFFVKKDHDFELRWFTPTVEIALCGHATVATAKVLFDLLGYIGDTLRFHTLSGVLTVQKHDDLFTLNFPANPPLPVAMPPGLPEALGIAIFKDVQLGRNGDYLIILDSEEAVAKLTPDFSALEKTDIRAVIVSAKGKDSDFVSRFFAPKMGINEDPVTGSAHTILAPYWAEKLGKTAFFARQISARRGDLWLILLGDRLEMSGKAVVYLVGEIYV